MPVYLACDQPCQSSALWKRHAESWTYLVLAPRSSEKKSCSSFTLALSGASRRASSGFEDGGSELVTGSRGTDAFSGSVGAVEADEPVLLLEVDMAGTTSAGTVNSTVLWIPWSCSEVARDNDCDEAASWIWARTSSSRVEANARSASEAGGRNASW